MTFSSLTQSGSGASIRVDNASICALIGGLSPAGAAQTMVVTRERVANIFVASTVAATLAALTGFPYETVLLTQADGVLTARVVAGGIDEIKPLGSANSTLVLKDGTTLDVVGTPTVIAALFSTSFTAGQIIGSALFNADGSMSEDCSYNIAQGAHTTGNYAGSLIIGTCTVFAVITTLIGTGNIVGLVLMQGNQSSTSAFAVASRLAADGTTATDHPFAVTLVCITP